MTTRKQYWLATAALISAGTAAQAADLPFRKAAPVEYVRICDAFGAGFFYIPGTDTCLRVSGQVRAEYSFRPDAPTLNQAQFAYNKGGQVFARDLSSFRARAYLNADARTQTAYGTLRAYVSLRDNIDSTPPGPFGGRGVLGVAGVPTGVRASTGLFQGLPSRDQPSLDKAFVQFAGLTAGRVQSFFDFDAQSYELFTNTVANSNQVTSVLAYTATFGGGFSATVSAEDPSNRRIGDDGTVTHSQYNNFALPTALAGNFNNPILGAAGAPGRAGVMAYGGNDIPDFVANVRYDASWGSAQISGAYHQLNALPTDVLNATASGVVSSSTPSADGFAVIGGIKVLLPSLAKGDNFTLQGSYEEGAMDYVNSVNYLPVGLTNVYNTSTTGVGTVYGVPLNDAFVLTNGTIAKNQAVGAFGAFRHYFVPDVYGSLYGSYLDITNPRQAERLGTGTDSAQIYQIGANVVWTPAKDFQIGAEALYTNVNYASHADGLYFGNGGAAAAGVAGSVGSGTNKQNPDDYRARLSLRRAF